jgi:tetratricopeptide (TPR) repeat protein
VVFGVQLFFLRTEQGRLDELVDGIKAFADQFPEMTGWRCALARAYAELDRRAEAQQELELLAPDDFADVTREPQWLASVSNLSEVVALLGDVRRAELLYQLLLPYADRCVVVPAAVTTGSASRSLGLLATTTGRFDEATRHFEDALAMNAKIKSPLWLAHTRHDYARMLLRRDAPGDRENALELLAQSRHSAEELGLVALANSVRTLVNTAPPAA